MREIREILRSRAVLLLIMHFCFIRVLDFWIVSHSYAQTSQQWWAYPGFPTCLVCILLIIIGERFVQRTLFWLKASLLALFMLSIIAISGITGLTIDELWIDISFVISWAVLAWLYVRCTLSISQFPITSIIVIIMFGSMVGAFFVTAISWLSGAIGTVVSLLLILALLANPILPEKPPSSPHRAQRLYRDTPSLLFRLALPMASVVLVYSLVNIFLKTHYGSWAFGPAPILVVPLIAQTMVALCFALLLWWVFIRKNTLNFLLLLKIPTILMIVALIFVVFGGSPLLQVITYGSALLMVPFIWLTSIEVTRHSNIKSVRILAFGLMLYSAPYLAGRLLFSLGASLQNDFVLNQNSALVLLGILALSFILPVSSDRQTAKLMFDDVNNKALEPADYQTLNDRCEALGKMTGLSEREIEVVVHLVKGHSKPFIAESLFISDNTVRTYTKRIYEKLDIHSRRELQERIDI